MVRNYVKKSDRNTWSEGQLQLALSEIRDGQSIKHVSSKYGIPRTTLQRRYTTHVSSSNTGFKRTFNDEQENALYECVVDLEKRLMSLSTKELRKLAFDYATKFGVPHNFDKSIGLAGKDWVRSFMSRHNLANRKAEPTSAARVNGFNKEAVDQFFTLLKETPEKYNISANNIWNVDETGISIVSKSRSRVVAQKGRKQVGGKTAAERGETVRAEICMSATGSFMPPMLIFPPVKVDEQYPENKPHGLSGVKMARWKLIFLPSGSKNLLNFRELPSVIQYYYF